MTLRQAKVLADKIKAALKEPKHFQQIEDVVGKQKEFMLGIALTNLTIKGEIYREESYKYQTEHTMYSLAPFPQNYRPPIRDESVTPRKR
jgi:DNA-binding HxlR family transcriptional regulator